MDLELLQKYINERQISSIETFYIFVNGGVEGSFLSNQYIDIIADLRDLSIQYVDDILCMSSNKNDIFGSEETIDNNKLYVHKIDKFQYNDLSIKNIKNLIIVCNSIDKCCIDIFSSYIVNMPKLEDWHIKDYVYSVADGVDHKKLEWLISICNKDIYRIDNELSKLSLFNEKERDLLFEMFANDGMFSDLSELVVFDLTNAILKRDIKKVGYIMEEIKNFDCEPLGVNTILVNSFRNILSIQLSQNPTAEKLGMKGNQFYALKKLCGSYTKEQLVRIYDLVTSVEYRMKNGEISNDQLIDYLVLNIFSI